MFIRSKIIVCILFVYTTISAASQIYHEDDKEGLRAFLRQPSAETGKINAQQLGLQLSDTLDWKIQEEWVTKVIALTWNEETPKRLIEAGNERAPIFFDNWELKKLAGNLNCNKWTDLTKLYCSYNYLTALDIKDCIALKTLRCESNQIITLDVSNNLVLEELICNSNQLTALDVCNNSALITIDCRYNPITTLEISNKMFLTQINYRSCPFITNLIISNCTALTLLEITNNKSLTTLNISDCTALFDLQCDYNQLTTLNISNCTALKNLNCTSNQLSHLDISDCRNLSHVVCSRNRLTFSTLANVEFSSQGYHYYYYPQKPKGYKTISFTESLDLSDEFSITYNENTVITDYQWYDGNVEITSGITNNNGVFTFSQELVGKKLECRMTNNNFSYLNLTYIIFLKQNSTDNYFHADDNEGLRNFLRENNNFVPIGLRTEDTINWNINENWIFYIDGLEWSNETVDNRLLSIKWYNKNLRGQLNACKWTYLTSLDCNTNKLTTLDVSNCPSLTTLYCFSNKLTAIEFNNNANLDIIYCAYNELQTIDLSNMPALLELSSCDNLLTTLDISNNTALTWLGCSNNLLTTLDVSNNTMLDTLVCSRNQLLSLDVSNNTALLCLDCYDNQFETLDLTKNTVLKKLDCSNNRLKILNITDCNDLTALYCRNNYLFFSKLPSNQFLYYGYAPQRTISGDSVDYKLGIDLNKEYNINGNITQFSWFELTDNIEKPLTLTGENGFFLLTKDLINKTLTCKMTNQSFPLLSGDYSLGYRIKVIGEVGIVEYSNSDNKSIKVFPNPTRGEFQVTTYETTFGDSQLQIENIELFDVFGKNMYLSTRSPVHLSTITIDISHLQSGIYYLKCNDETIKIIKN